MHLYLLINLLRATANGRFLGDNRSILASFAPVLPDHLSSSHLAGTRNEQETSRSLLYLSSVAPGFACSPLCEQGPLSWIISYLDRHKAALHRRVNECF